MYDDEYDEEDIDDEDTEVKKPSPDEPVSLVLSGYTARRMDELVESHLMSIVRQAVEAKVDKLVAKTIEAKVDAVVAAIADDVIRERLKDELDICLEEGWKPTDRWGKSCGGTVTLKDRVAGFLNQEYGSKQNGERILREVIKEKISEQISAYAKQIRERLQVKVDELVRERVGADKVVAEQLKQTVADVFGLKA